MLPKTIFIYKTIIFIIGGLQTIDVHKNGNNLASWPTIGKRECPWVADAM